MKKNSNIDSNTYLEENQDKVDQNSTILNDSLQNIKLKQIKKNVSMSYFNGCFDKKRLKSLISWSLKNCGEKITIDLLENLKNIGFTYATQAGISLGIDDLKIPLTKKNLISDAEIQIQIAQLHHEQAYLTGIEKFQQLIDTWHRTSETLKQNVVQYFKSTDVFNPVYMMAFSGARGNISQVRQLVGMRGLMSDPQGEILDFPIKSNFREGLTLTEYIISCYGARKGLVDTALKTANSGYLTRRLVDVSHHIIVCDFDCKTQRGIIITNLFENEKIIVPLKNRLIGRLLAENIYSDVKNIVVVNNSSSETPVALLGKQAKEKQRLKSLQSFTLNKRFHRAFNSNTYNIKQIRKNRAKVFALFYNLAYNYFFQSEIHIKQEKSTFFQNSMQLSLSSINLNQQVPEFYLTEFNSAKVFLSYQNLFFAQAENNFKQIFKIDPEYIKYTNKLLCRLKHIYLFALRYELIAPRNTEISPNLASKIATLKNQVLVRSPLTCEIKDSVCQLCYGWSLAHGKLVSLGEAVGIIAAQSIGEPGTQLTMRTFHTGGVFSGDIMSEILAPFDGRVEFQDSLQGVLVRTSHGKIAFLTKVSGELKIQQIENSNLLTSKNKQETTSPFSSDATRDKPLTKTIKIFKIPPLTLLFVRNHEYVPKSQIIAEFSSILAETSQRIQANYDLKTQIQGEVFFKYVTVITKFKKKKLLNRTTTKLGSIWILSGKIYQPYLPVNIFPQPGDLIDENSLIGEYESISPYNGFTSIKSNLTQHKEKISRNQIISLHNWKYQISNNVIFEKNKQYKFYKQSSSPIHSQVFLNHNILFFPIQSIHYKKIGYFFSFFQSSPLGPFLGKQAKAVFPSKRQNFKLKSLSSSKLSLDRFFISNSFQQGFSNFNKLQQSFYLISFPKQFQTKSGGLITYNNFFVNKKYSCGEIFWIPEETYTFNLFNIILVNLSNNSINAKKDKKNYFRLNKWIITDNSLVFYTNKQGKISNFFSKLYGYAEISLPNSVYQHITNKVGSPFDCVSQPTGFVSLLENSKSVKLHFGYDTIGFKINPASFIYQIKKFNLLSTFTHDVNQFQPRLNWLKRVPLKTNSTQLNPKLTLLAKTNFISNLKFRTFSTQKIYFYFVNSQKQNKMKNSILLKNHEISVLKPQFPWCNEISKKFNFNSCFENKQPSLFQIPPLTYCKFQKSSNLSQNSTKKQNYTKNKISLKIKSGWTYFPLDNTILKKNLCFITPGKKFFHTILFDQYPVYVEFLSFTREINYKFVKQAKIDFLNAKSIQKNNTNLKKALNFSSIYHEFCRNQIKCKDFHYNSNLYLYQNGIYIIKNNTTYKIPIFKQKINIKLCNFDTITTRYISFKKNKNLFIPKFFMLIHKIKSYSFLDLHYYKNLLAQQNQSSRNSIITSTKLNKLYGSVSYSPQFNKQHITHLFFNFPTADFSVTPYFQYKKYTRLKNSISKKNASLYLNTFYTSWNNFIYFSKNTTILKFCIQFSIPTNYPLNAAKIQLISKFASISALSSMMKKLSLVSKRYAISMTSDFAFANKTSYRLASPFGCETQPAGFVSLLESLIKKNNTLFFNSNLYFSLSVFRELKFSNFLSNKTKNCPHTQTKLVIFYQNFISPQTPLNFTSFFSPYKGEIIHTVRDTSVSQSLVSNNNKDENTQDQLIEISKSQSGYYEKQKWLILTNFDQLSFSIINSRRNLSIDKLKSKVKLKVFLGECVRYGTKLHENLAIPESGRIIQIEKSKITLRKAQSILFTSKGLLSVYQGDIVEKNSLILRLFYQRLQTGDIVQGIPKIEQLFEARKTNKGEILLSGIHQELHYLFYYYSHKINMSGSKKFTFEQAARKSLEKIQQSIVRNVQKVYQSQGVTIAEKHFEIIVREMTSKVEVISSGKTNFIAGELVDLHYIKDVNESIECDDNKVRYQPIILGITQKSLNTKSFISEASFQETTRILAKSAMERSTDFLKGLKENVILGHVIPAGTGFSDKMFNSNKLPYSIGIKKNFQNSSKDEILKEFFFKQNYNAFQKNFLKKNKFKN